VGEWRELGSGGGRCWCRWTCMKGMGVLGDGDVLRGRPLRRAPALVARQLEEFGRRESLSLSTKITKSEKGSARQSTTADGDRKKGERQERDETHP
jgi:hypothetical protein